MAKFIEFQEVRAVPRSLWLVQNKRGQILARIEWYAPWARYVAVFREEAVWSSDCLEDMRAFMVKLEGK